MPIIGGTKMLIRRQPSEFTEEVKAMRKTIEEIATENAPLDNKSKKDEDPRRGEICIKDSLEMSFDPDDTKKPIMDRLEMLKFHKKEPEIKDKKAKETKEEIVYQAEYKRTENNVESIFIRKLGPNPYLDGNGKNLFLRSEDSERERNRFLAQQGPKLISEEIVRISGGEITVYDIRFETPEYI
jgi:hypothetical protein